MVTVSRFFHLNLIAANHEPYIDELKNAYIKKIILSNFYFIEIIQDQSNIYNTQTYQRPIDQCDVGAHTDPSEIARTSQQYGTEVWVEPSIMPYYA